MFTREEFYELVWSRPLTDLAKEFAISDVALHKICRKHGIPNPPLGWWAKQRAGKQVRRTPLPKAKDRASTKIVIAGADLGREQDSLRAVREGARILASAGETNEAPPAHPVVDRTLARLRKAKPGERGLVAVSGGGVIACEIAPASIDRLASILPKLVQAASLQGFALKSGEGSAYFQSDAERVAFAISEQFKREKHVLTDAENAKEAAWRRKRDRAARGNEWDEVFFDRPRFAEWDYDPTGRLSLEFEHVYLGDVSSPRRSFRDAKIQRLETMASDIAVALAVLAAAKTEQRLRREAEQRRLEEERRKREIAARARHVEERRMAGMSKILAELDELGRLRGLVANLTMEMSADLSPRVSTFVLWAKQHLAAREERLSAPGLETQFEKDELFGDADDHAFSPNRFY